MKTLSGGNTGKQEFPFISSTAKIKLPHADTETQGEKRSLASSQKKIRKKVLNSAQMYLEHERRVGLSLNVSVVSVTLDRKGSSYHNLSTLG